MHHALRTRRRLAEGETVLVGGAAGGIGTSTLRLALGVGRLADDRGRRHARTRGPIARVGRRHPTWCWPTGSRTPSMGLTGGQAAWTSWWTPSAATGSPTRCAALAAGRRAPRSSGSPAVRFPTVKVNRLLLNNVDAVGVGWGAWAGTHPGYLARTVGRAGTAARFRRGVGAATRWSIRWSGGRRGHGVAGGPERREGKVVVKIR